MKIKEVKEKIYKEKGEDFRVEYQKLILLGFLCFWSFNNSGFLIVRFYLFKGKVLEDKQTVSEHNINENSSLVCFAAKVSS